LLAYVSLYEASMISKKRRVTVNLDTMVAAV
jgi:hypothetical protein